MASKIVCSRCPVSLSCAVKMAAEREAVRSPFSIVPSRIDITFGRFLHHSGKSSARGRSNRWESFSFRLSGREVKLDFMFSQYEFLLNCGYFDIHELKIETS